MRWFWQQPANAKDLHRDLTASDNLDEILAWRERGEQTVTRNLSLHYDRMMLLAGTDAVGARVDAQESRGGELPADGRFMVQFWRRFAAPFRVFDKIQTVQSARSLRTNDWARRWRS